VEKKEAVALQIGLQTQVLKCCSIHNQIYLDDDADPGSAFALAIELAHNHAAFAGDFHDEHELTDLLSLTLGTTPLCCPECSSPLGLEALRDRGGSAQGLLEFR
jgi:hypothetical protein